MSSEASCSEESGTMHRNDIMLDIRKALGITTLGTSATISNERTRRILGSLEMLETDQLAALLTVSRKAFEFSALEPGAERREEGAKIIGEDAFFLLNRIYRNKLSDVFPLASIIDNFPSGVTISEAASIVERVTSELFSIESPETLTAHLRVGSVVLGQTNTYSQNMMLLVNTHPDKAETIITLYQGKNTIPTNRDVITYHGVAPIFFDGVL